MLTDQLVRTRPLSPFETEPSVCLDVSFLRSLVRTCLSGNGPKGHSRPKRHNRISGPLTGPSVGSPLERADGKRDSSV